VTDLIDVVRFSLKWGVVIMRNFINCNFNKHLVVSLLVFVYITGCTATPTSALHLLSDDYFPEHKKYPVETPSQVFKLGPPATEFVKKATEGKYTHKEKVRALVGAIFGRGNLSMNYLSQANYTANETFDKGNANCLSLTIMVYSMSQQIGLETQFKEINIPELWTRRGGNTLLTRHINIQVQPDRNQIAEASPITIDFDPMQGSHKFSYRILQEQQVLSHFYSNKAADALVDKNNDLAYAYLKAALEKSQTNTGAWLNLGVLFSRNNMLSEAETAYLRAKDLDSNDSTALENLAALYRKTNRVSQSVLIEKRLRDKRYNNPYYHTMLGDVSFEENNYDSAIRHYKKAIALNHKAHEFYYNLAKVYFSMGDLENGKRYLLTAKQRANDDKQEQKYALELLLLASR
jgi:tetratricopeptide (TPR) repeat protein